MRLGWVVLATALVAPAFAQVNGVPASVTSVRSTPDGRLIPNGVPASVTSLGPQGFTPGINPLFPASGPLTNPLQPGFAPARHDGDRHHRGDRTEVIPVYVPVYGGGYYYDPNYYAQPEQPQPAAENNQQQPQKLEIVLVDKREQEQKAQAQQDAELQAAAEPKKSELSSPPEEPAIFVFKDGTRKELANFAVMGSNLYDLSEGRMMKIALNTIDRDATLAANAKIGRQIQLP